MAQPAGGIACSAVQHSGAAVSTVSSQQGGSIGFDPRGLWGLHLLPLSGYCTPKLSVGESVSASDCLDLALQ